MFIILGGTGHVGSAAAEALLEAGEEVTIVTHDDDKASEWEDRGAKVAVADVRDPDALRDVLRMGTRAFLLNPPAAPDTDTDAVELETVRGILAAIDESGLEKVVAHSTYGAQPGERIGDLSTLYELEEGVRAQSIPHAILRAAYYFTNWDAQLDPVRKTGKLSSMYPADLDIPMVSPTDLGREAARVLMAPVDEGGVFYMEGPERYSAADVAAAFEAELDRPVEVDVIPREKWEETFRALGFSEPAADAYTRMTAISVDGGFDMPDDPIRGSVTLEEHVAGVVAGSAD